MFGCTVSRWKENIKFDFRILSRASYAQEEIRYEVLEKVSGKDLGVNMWVIVPAKKPMSELGRDSQTGGRGKCSWQHRGHGSEKDTVTLLNEFTILQDGLLSPHPGQAALVRS